MKATGTDTLLMPRRTGWRHWPSWLGWSNWSLIARFSVLGLCLLGVTGTLLLLLSLRASAEQATWEQKWRGAALASSIALEVGGAVRMGMPVDALVGTQAYLTQRQNLDRLTAVRLRDATQHIVASLDWPLQGHAFEASMASAPVQDARGSVVGYVDVIATPTPQPTLVMIRIASLLTAVLSVVALAAEALRYSLAAGPGLRERIVASAQARLANENYSALLLGAPRRGWDNRPQQLVLVTRRVNENERRLSHLVASLQRTESDEARRLQLDKALETARGHAVFGGAHPSIHRHGVTVEEARAIGVLLTSCVGGLGQLSAAFDQRLPAVWYFACILSGLALGAHWFTDARIRATKSTRKASNATHSQQWTSGRLVCLSSGAVVVLAVGWAAVAWASKTVLPVPWFVLGTIGNTLTGVLLAGVLTGAYTAIAHAYRHPAFTASSASPLYAGVGGLLGLLWFGPFLSSVLSERMPTWWVAACLAAVAVGATVLAWHCAREHSPWQGVPGCYGEQGGHSAYDGYRGYREQGDRSSISFFRNQWRDCLPAVGAGLLLFFCLPETSAESHDSVRFQCTAIGVVIYLVALWWRRRSSVRLENALRWQAGSPGGLQRASGVHRLVRHLRIAALTMLCAFAFSSVPTHGFAAQHLGARHAS